MQLQYTTAAAAAAADISTTFMTILNVILHMQLQYTTTAAAAAAAADISTTFSFCSMGQ